MQVMLAGQSNQSSKERLKKMREASFPTGRLLAGRARVAGLKLWNSKFLRLK